MMNRIQDPQNERSRRTRAAILDATWRLLEESDDHVSMAAVAERAGITRRSLYLHFSSRSDLLLALHAHVDTTLDLAASTQPIFDAPDAVTALRQFARHLAEFHPQIQHIDRAILRLEESDPDVASLVRQGIDAWLTGCRSVTQRLADEGRLADPWTVDTAADLLWHFMFPEVLQRLTQQRNWSSEQYRDLLTTVLIRTLVKD
jgi:AcrR family transcriptional regulator